MFSRTSSGIKNIHLFYSGYYIVIVEGSSDAPFWSNLFPDEVEGYKRKIKPVGGRPEVQKYIDEILSEETKFAVAIDSDYSLLVGSSTNHSRIVETRYHSIENLMLCPYVITSIIRNLSHDIEYSLDKVETWLQHFDSTTFILMTADFLIEKNKLGQPCVGDNCSPFLSKNNNPVFDESKIINAIGRLPFSQQDLDAANHHLQVQGFKPRFHIRGHFFFSAVLCFVSSEVKRIRQKSVSISNDTFYAMSISSCETCTSTDPILQEIRTRALLAAKEVAALLP